MSSSVMLVSMAFSNTAACSTPRTGSPVVVAVATVVASPQSTVIGGAAQTVRDLVAAWEQRDVMAREIAVDVAADSKVHYRRSMCRRQRKLMTSG
jgi:acyl transferase domain-containing protein